MVVSYRVCNGASLDAVIARVGFRDPSRAVPMADGKLYVGVGSGFGGTGPTSNEKSGTPGSGTGCLAWLASDNEELLQYETAVNRYCISTGQSMLSNAKVCGASIIFLHSLFARCSYLLVCPFFG